MAAANSSLFADSINIPFFPVLITSGKAPTFEAITGLLNIDATCGIPDWEADKYGQTTDLQDEINDFLKLGYHIIRMHYCVAMCFSSELEYSFSCLIEYDDKGPK